MVLCGRSSSNQAPFIDKFSTSSLTFSSYVDTSRMISVELGGEGDLKNQMQENIKKWGGDFNLGGEYHDYNIVKLAEHYMKKGFYKSALEVLSELLHSSHPSMVTMFFLPLNRLNRAPIQLNPKETLNLRSLDFILTLLGNIGPVLGTFLELPNLQCLIIWGNYSFKIYKR